MAKAKSPKVEVKTIEKIVEKIIEVPKKELAGFALYKKLKEVGFPQGGVGNWVENDLGERVYMPQAGEIYQSFVGEPTDWNKVTDALARVWIDKNTK